MAHITEYVSEQIKNHTESFDENNIRDFVDIYLKSENLQNEKEEKAGSMIYIDTYEMYSQLHFINL